MYPMDEDEYRNSQYQPRGDGDNRPDAPKCTHPGCRDEADDLSDSRECGWHTLRSLELMAADEGRDQYIDGEIARWNKRVGVTK